MKAKEKIKTRVYSHEKPTRIKSALLGGSLVDTIIRVSCQLIAGIVFGWFGFSYAMNRTERHNLIDCWAHPDFDTPTLPEYTNESGSSQHGSLAGSAGSPFGSQVR